MSNELTPEELDDQPPEPDMKLRRLAIKAGLIEETDVDKFHSMAEAMGLHLITKDTTHAD